MFLWISYSKLSPPPKHGNLQSLLCYIKVLIVCVVNVIIYDLRLHKLSALCQYTWKYHNVVCHNYQCKHGQSSVIVQCCLVYCCKKERSSKRLGEWNSSAIDWDVCGICCHRVTATMTSSLWLSIHLIIQSQTSGTWSGIRIASALSCCPLLMIRSVLFRFISFNIVAYWCRNQRTFDICLTS